MNSRNFLLEFIKCYELNPALWDSKSVKYSSKNEKDKSYNVLHKVLIKYKKNADMSDVKKKINTLRTNFRREYRKIKRSEADGYVYKPHLWWFDNLRFLRYEQKPKQSVSDLENQDQSQDQYENEYKPQYQEYEGEFMMEEEKPICSYELEIEKPKPKSKKIRLAELEIQPPKIKKAPPHDESELMECSVLSKDSDTFDHMCKAWAGNLRDMDKSQSIIAGRAISEIIFQGQLGILTIDSIPRIPPTTSTIVNPYNIKTQSTTNCSRVSEDQIFNYKPIRSQHQLDCHDDDTSTENGG